LEVGQVINPGLVRLESAACTRQGSWRPQLNEVGKVMMTFIQSGHNSVKMNGSKRYYRLRWRSIISTGGWPSQFCEIFGPDPFRLLNGYFVNRDGDEHEIPLLCPSKERKTQIPLGVTSRRGT
jgi:hypothetical protein